MVAATLAGKVTATLAAISTAATEQKIYYN